MKINEIFGSIQGEGKYAGYPVMFIRTSGCNRKCSWCDTKYHVNGDFMSIDDIVDKIIKYNKNIIVWTGGEPLLQRIEIYEVIKKTPNYEHHLETNGDFLHYEDLKYFDYISVSPKDEEATIKVYNLLKNFNKNKYDIKIVMDENVSSKMIEKATMLMPLTTYNEKQDLLNEQKVWEIALKYNKKFCLRQHYVVWGKKKGV